MHFTFTDYVRCLGRGQKPDPDLLGRLLDRLRSAVSAELHRRALWNTPPSYLGIYGGRYWSAPEAVEELTVDCYLFVFGDRLEGLLSHLEHRDNIEGLVYRNIRNFFYDRQKKHDPLGFRVFVETQKAVRQAVSEGLLHVLSGGPKIANETMLGFLPWWDPTAVQPAVDLSDNVAEWNHKLFPKLLTSRGAELREMTAELVSCLAHLQKRGVERFSFKEVIEPLKQDTRARWAAMLQSSHGEQGFEDGTGEFSRIVPLVRPGDGFEERQSFEKLLARIPRALDDLQLSASARGYVHQLWLLVHSVVVEHEEDRLPAKTQIAEMLDIPRYRIPELLRILNQAIRHCRADH